MFAWKLTFFLIILFLSSGCGKDAANEKSFIQSSPTSNKVNANLFSDSLLIFKVHVFYESGATPYVDNLGLTSNPAWGITKASFQALFQNHPGRTVSVPTTLAQMTQIGDQGKTIWSTTELLTLGNQLAPDLIQGTQGNLSVIFLNGTFNGNNNILGVNFSGFPFSFVFKDIVVGAGGDSVGQRYVEQATVVHELGHAIGLVNNGLPMVSSHEDGAHARHSSDSNCVMYWMVESKDTILSSLTNMMLGKELNLFGPQSLQDGRSYHP